LAKPTNHLHTWRLGWLKRERRRERERERERKRGAHLLLTSASEWRQSRGPGQGSRQVPVWRSWVLCVVNVGCGFKTRRECRLIVWVMTPL